jgi:uncharacterized membrane protein SpoIIM required for sporulation
MVTPLQFEQAYGAQWAALESQLDKLEAPAKPGAQLRSFGADAAEVARLYRAACEHLALARERGYPLHLAERLDTLTSRAHRLIYHRPPRGLQPVWRFLREQFPRTLRAEWRLMALALLAFVGPLLAVGIATWLDPSFALTLSSAQHLADFDAMYGDEAASIGRERGAQTDWVMFGYYVRNNISVSFQCFATGLLAGVGSLFFLAYNGALIGAVAGYLTARGLGHNFWAFVATHSSLELTAIVISGAAGLRLGQALLAPGRRSRGHALREGARSSAVLVGGAAVMLLGAAVLEAFWSSARWLPAELKYGVAALCWVAVVLYLLRAGRPKAGHAG